MPTTNIKSKHKLTGNGFSSRTTNIAQMGGSESGDKTDGTSEDATVCLHPAEKVSSRRASLELPTSIGESSNLFSQLKGQAQGRQLRIMSKGHSATGSWSESVIDAGGGTLALSDMNLPSDILQNLANRGIDVGEKRVLVDNDVNTIHIQHGDDSVKQSSGVLESLGVRVRAGLRVDDTFHDLATTSVGFSDLADKVGEVVVPPSNFFGASYDGTPGGNGVFEMGQSQEFTVEFWVPNRLGMGSYTGLNSFYNAGTSAGSTYNTYLLSDRRDFTWQTFHEGYIFVHRPVLGNTSGVQLVYPDCGLPGVGTQHQADLHTALQLTYSREYSSEYYAALAEFPDTTLPGWALPGIDDDGFDERITWELLIKGSDLAADRASEQFIYLTNGGLPWADAYKLKQVETTVSAATLTQDGTRSFGTGWPSDAYYTPDSTFKFWTWVPDFSPSGTLVQDIRDEQLAKVPAVTDQFPESVYYFGDDADISVRPSVTTSLGTIQERNSYGIIGPDSDLFQNYPGTDVVLAATNPTNGFPTTPVNTILLAWDRDDAVYSEEGLPPNASSDSISDLVTFVNGEGSAYSHTLEVTESHEAELTRSSGVISSAISDEDSVPANPTFDARVRQTVGTSEYFVNTDPLPTDSGVESVTSQDVLKGAVSSDIQEYFDTNPAAPDDTFTGSANLVTADDSEGYLLSLTGRTSVKTVGMKLRDNVLFSDPNTGTVLPIAEHTLFIPGYYPGPNLSTAYRNYVQWAVWELYASTNITDFSQRTSTVAFYGQYSLTEMEGHPRSLENTSAYASEGFDKLFDWHLIYGGPINELNPSSSQNFHGAWDAFRFYSGAPGGPSNNPGPGDGGITDMDSVNGAALVLNPISVLGNAYNWVSVPSGPGQPVGPSNTWFDARQLATDLLNPNQVATMEARLDQEVFLPAVPYKYNPYVVFEAVLHAIATDYVNGANGWDLDPERLERDNHWSDEQYLNEVKRLGSGVLGADERFSWDGSGISTGLSEILTESNTALGAIGYKPQSTEGFSVSGELDELVSDYNVSDTGSHEINICSVDGERELRVIEELFRLCVNSSRDSSTEVSVVNLWYGVAGPLAALTNKVHLADQDPQSDPRPPWYPLTKGAFAITGGLLGNVARNRAYPDVVNEEPISDLVTIDPTLKRVDLSTGLITLPNGSTGTAQDSVNGAITSVVVPADTVVSPESGFGLHPDSNDDAWSPAELALPTLPDVIYLADSITTRDRYLSVLDDTVDYRFNFLSAPVSTPGGGQLSESVLSADSSGLYSVTQTLRMFPVDNNLLYKGHIAMPEYHQANPADRGVWMSPLPLVSLLDSSNTVNSLGDVSASYSLRNSTLVKPAIKSPIYNLSSATSLGAANWKLFSFHGDLDPDLSSPNVSYDFYFGHLQMISPPSTQQVADLGLTSFDLQLVNDPPVAEIKWEAEADVTFDGKTGLFLYDTGESQRVHVGDFVDSDVLGTGLPTVTDSLLTREYRGRQAEFDSALDSNQEGGLLGFGVDTQVGTYVKPSMQVPKVAHPSVSPTSASNNVSLPEGSSDKVGISVLPWSSSGTRYYQYTNAGGYTRYMYPVFSGSTAAAASDISFGGSGASAAYIVTTTGGIPSLVPDPSAVTLAPGEKLVYVPGTAAVDIRDTLSREFIKYDLTIQGAIWDRTVTQLGDQWTVSVAFKDGYQDTVDMFFAGADVALSGRDTYPVQKVSYSGKHESAILLDGTHTVSDLTGKGRITPGSGGSLDIVVSGGEVTSVRVTDPGSGFTLGSGIYIDKLADLGLSSSNNRWIMLKVDSVDLDEGAPVDLLSPVNPNAGTAETALLTWDTLATAATRPASGGLSSDPDPGRAILYEMYNLGVDTDNDPGEPWLAPSPCVLSARQQEAVKAGLTLKGSRLASRFLPGTTGTEIQSTSTRRLYKTGQDRIAAGNPQHAMASPSDDPFTIDSLYLDDFLPMRYVNKAKRL